MKLVFGKQQIDYKDIPSSDDIIKKINELVAESYHFSHFIADGIEVYEQHEDYLNLNVDRVKILEVIAKTEKEFMNDVLLSSEDYLKRAKPELAALPKGFNVQPTTETWTSFEMLLEGAQWLNDMLAVMGESRERPANWDAYASLSGVMQGELSKLGHAVGKENHELIGDILREGLIPNFGALEVEIGKSIDAQGTRANLN